MGQANVALHVIDPRGFSGRAEDDGAGFAVSTGGAAGADTNDLDQAVERI